MKFLKCQRCDSNYIHFIKLDHQFKERTCLESPREDGVVSIFFCCEVCGENSSLLLTSRKGEILIEGCEVIDV